MSPESQRIAIAEACGWTECEKDGSHNPLGRKPGETCDRILPDYLNDLNAMHDAEKVLTEEQWTDYLNQLYHLTFVPGAKDRDRQAVTSTAAQRGEAFPRAIGKWKEVA